MCAHPPRMHSSMSSQTDVLSAKIIIGIVVPKFVAAKRRRQFVKRRILTFRMRPNAASVATSDDPP